MKLQGSLPDIPSLSASRSLAILDLACGTKTYSTSPRLHGSSNHDCGKNASMDDFFALAADRD